MSILKATLNGFRSIGAGLASIAGGITSICLSLGDILESYTSSYSTRARNYSFSYSYEDDDDDYEEDDDEDDTPSVYRWRYAPPGSRNTQEEDARIEAELDLIFSDMDKAFEDMNVVFADMDKIFDDVGIAFDRVDEDLNRSSASAYRRKR